MSLPVNQIISADALSSLATFPRESIDVCLTSPPYFQKMNYLHPDQYGLEPTIEEFLFTLKQVFVEVYRILKNGSCCWVIVGDTMNNYSPIRAKGQRRKTGEYLHRRPKQVGYREKEVLNIPFKLVEVLREIGFLHRQTLIWDKGTSGEIANSDTAPSTHEYILQLGKWDLGGRPYLNCEPMRSSVLRFAPTSNPIHPCPFPVPLAQLLIEKSSQPGQIILDPFLGSGSTAEASILAHRQFVGIELNPQYAEIARRRLQQVANFA